MQRCIGIRREDKSRWERRVPITPRAAAVLAQQGIQTHLQPAAQRVFAESEFAGVAHISEDLAPCPVIFGVKEIPKALIEPQKTYIFFAHVVKGQPHNMPMLRRLLELGCTLIDYERVTDDAGRRLIFFGRHAGLAGALETLWALGQRFADQGLITPFAQLRHAYEYADMAEALAAVTRVGDAIRAEGLPPGCAPLTIGVTGYGNVARGAWEVLARLPIEEIQPHQLAEIHATPVAARHHIYATTFREEHTVIPRVAQKRFDCQHYYDYPDDYEPIFARHLPYLSAIINGVYWDARYPRLVTKADLRHAHEAGHRKLQVIGDISCDIEGSIECTAKTTAPDAPVYVYHPVTGETTDGHAGEGVAVMAVDILPAELPRDASESFSAALAPFVLAIATADYAAPYAELNLPPPIQRAVITHRGELAPSYQYLTQFLEKE